MRAYSRVDETAEAEVDVHEGIENTLTILRHRLGDVTLARDYDRSLPPIRVLANELNQVWTNLLDNAIDAMSGQGRLGIRTSRDSRDGADHLVVEISDDGAGVSQEHLTRVWEPFFSTKGEGKGTGLGLDIVRRIVMERYQGDVEVDSQAGDTKFRVFLPVAIPREEERAAVPS